MRIQILILGFKGLTVSFSFLFTSGDTSPSPRVSLLLWILVAAAAALILVVGVLIFVIRAKHKKAGFNVRKEVSIKQRQRCIQFIFLSSIHTREFF